MSNIVQPSYEINYISQQKRILVGRNNNTIYQKFKIDNQIQDTYYFQVVSKNNQIVDLSGFSYQFFGSYIDAKQNTHVLFYSDDYTIEDNTLSFKVNTYTTEYLNYVKVKREIDLTIKKKATGIDQVILRDVGLAYPSPIYEGEEPSPVIAGFGLSKNGYVMSLTGSVLSGDGTTIQINDNVISFIGETAQYTAGTGIGISEQNVISLTATIPLSTSQLTNDSNYVTSSELDNYIITGTVPGDDQAVRLRVKGSNDSVKVSWLINDKNYQTGQEVVDWVRSQGYLSSVPTTYVQQSDLAEYALTSQIPTDYVTSSELTGYAETSAIPSAVSQLSNDTGYLSSIVINIDGTDETQMTSLCLDNNFYVYQDMVGINIGNVYQSMYDSGLFVDYAQTSAIPSATSQLTNDSGYITSSELTGISVDNQQKMFIDDTVQGSGFVLGYNKDYDIFYNTITTDDGVLNINPLSGVDSIVSGKAATFEQWIKPSGDLSGITFASGLNFIGELPSGFTSGFTQVFTRRVIKKSGNTIQQISYAYEFEDEQSEPPTPPTPSDGPLTFTALQNNSVVQLQQIGSPSAITLNYSKNGGAWTAYTVGDTISLDQGETLALSGANDHFSKYRETDDYYHFNLTGSIAASGNIMSLMNFSNTCTDHCFVRLFQYCTSLVDASQLTLPATTLADWCYVEMFGDCSNLSAGPQTLPAATLAEWCYASMFWQCTSLVSSPYIASEPTADSCYANLFYGCSNLTSISVGFTSWGSNACVYWVGNVAENGTFYCPSALGTNETIGRGPYYCPENWTVVNV